MGQGPMRFDRATPVKRSEDYSRSKRFYTEILGFSVIEEGGAPPRFGIFRRDNAYIFVNSWDGGPVSRPSGWDAYIHINELDRFHESLKERVPDLPEVRLTEYGMREFELQDPDGNWICFGENG